MVKTKKEMTNISSINWLTDIKSYIESAIKRCESFNFDDPKSDLHDIINWLDISKESLTVLINNSEHREIKPCQLERNKKDVIWPTSKCLVVGDVIFVKGENVVITGVGENEITFSHDSLSEVLDV